MIELMAFMVLLSGIWILYGSFNCVHDWQPLDREVLPAAIELLDKSSREFTCSPFDIVKLARRVVIIIIKCPKCGKTKILRESNP